MNRFKKVTFVILFIICVCCINLDICVAADVGNVFLSSNKNSVAKEEEFEININLENGKTAAFSINLFFDDSKVQFVSGPDNMNLIGNRIIYVWHDTSGGNNAKDSELAKFKFIAKSDGVANFIVDGEFYDMLGQSIDINFEELQVQVGSNKKDNQEDKINDEEGKNTQTQNANLKVLRLNKEGIVPEFKEDIYEYYLNVLTDVSDIDILAISDNPNATVEITGNSNLNEGLNTITIKVTSEDKTQTRNYTIYVTKTSNLELANTNLEILAIQNVLLYPQFDTSITKYKAEVSNEITNLKILAIPENKNAIVNITRKDNLNEGSNILNISVTAQNGFSKREYVVEVYKRNLEEEHKYQEEIKDNQNKLEEIYEAEKLESEIQDNNEEKSTRKQKTIAIVAIGIIIISIGILIIYIKKKKR